MLVQSHEAQLYRSDEFHNDACVAQLRNDASHEHLVAPLQVRVLAVDLKDTPLKDYAYARVTRMLLQDFDIETTDSNINSYGYRIIDITRRFYISPVSILVAAYLLHTMKIGPASDLLRYFYASLCVSVASVECSLIRNPVTKQPICREHGCACALRETWFNGATDLFDSYQHLQYFDDLVYRASRSVFPLTTQDLEYFAETCLTSRASKQEQRVPGTLYHVLDCFQGDFV
jgi:hypothetical protein